MLFFLIILAGVVIQILLGVVLLVVNIEHLTILPTIIFATWFARRDDAFGAYAAGFILALVAASLGGGTRGIGLLSAFAGISFAVVTARAFRGPGWLSPLLHVFIAALIANLATALLFPLFGVGSGFGSIFLRVGILTSLLTSLFAFPIHAGLSRMDPLLHADSSGRSLVR